MNKFIQDVRFALRQLRRSLGFTATVVLTLALGIGLNAAIFTMVDCVLLRPLGYHDADRIYSLNTRFINESRSIPKMGGADYVDLSQQIRGLEHVAYYSAYQDGLKANGQSLYLDVANVSPQFGQVMGVTPVAGRLFRDEPDGQETMVSSSFAREVFGSAGAALGQSVLYDGKLRAVVGVLPDGFSFPGKTVVWIERPPSPEILSRTAYNQRAIGKAREGVSLATLNAEIATFSKQLAATYPEDKLKALEAVPLQEQIVGRIRPTLRLLMASVGIVLLIVCANVTHLQLVRSIRERREVGIRTALGATRGALARRASVEVLLLAVMGCGAGVLLAVPALRALVLLAPPDIPRLTDVRLNMEVVAFSFLLSLVTMGLTALLPLWHAWRVDPVSTMKEDSTRGPESRRSGRLREGLIAGEVALTLVLCVAALLLLRQFIVQSQQDLGFSPERLVLLDTHAVSGGSSDAEARVVALNSMLEGLRSVHGVESVSAVSGVPMGSGIADVSYAIHGRTEFKPGTVLPDANIVPVTPGYFETMKIPLLKGRGLTEADRMGSEMVLVISKAMAAQSFAGEDPIGKQIMCGFDSEGAWWTIVGVVGDVRQDSPASELTPTFYVPVAQHSMRASDMQVAVRTHNAAGPMAVTLQNYVKERFPAVAVSGITMRESVGDSQRPQEFRTMLFGCFAGVSILLAMVGMYGVAAYTVTQRRFEFALRFALGAQRVQVLTSVLRGALIVAFAGATAGIVLSIGMMRIAVNLIGKMPASDAVTYAIAVVGILFTTVAATLIPAYRAASIEPMQALRSE